MSGTLIVCATPIGNLSDVSPRLAEALREADVIYAEDTRRTKKLLAHVGVSTRLRSFFVGNERARLADVERDLEAGQTVALVSDAGMPTVSDPGASAVRAAVAAGATVTAVPGPSAVVTALAVSGFNADRFVFGGFLARKGTDRSTDLDQLVGETRTIVLFAAPSRVHADLGDLAERLGPDRPVVVARELTKLHEEMWRGSLGSAAEEFAGDERRRGEFTLVIEGARERRVSMDEAVEAALSRIAEGATTSDAVRDTATLLGVSRRELYERIVKGRS